MVVQLKYLVDVDLKQHVQMQQLKLHVQHQYQVNYVNGNMVIVD